MAAAKKMLQNRYTLTEDEDIITILPLIKEILKKKRNNNSSDHRTRSWLDINQVFDHQTTCNICFKLHKP